MNKYFRVGALHLGKALVGVVLVVRAAAQAVVYLRQVALLAVAVAALADGSKLAVARVFAGALGDQAALGIVTVLGVKAVAMAVN